MSFRSQLARCNPSFRLFPPREEKTRIPAGVLREPPATAGLKPWKTAACSASTRP